MNFVFFVHSLSSDWNNGNAHFLRGVVRELVTRGHAVRVFEPEEGWSAVNLLSDHGARPFEQFRATYPEIRCTSYRLTELDLDAALENADVVLVHEWNPPELVRRVGQHRIQSGRYLLCFHDTHHRALSDPEALHRHALPGYDAALVFGEILAQAYSQNGWGERVFSWHEAADTRLFRPQPAQAFEGDLVWIGNFGDEERTRELQEFLIEPARSLGLSARVYGVRYPESAVALLNRAGIEYAGYLPNIEVPQVFARFKVTVHVPRQPYARQLPGIPTIRPFEALACQIPLVSAPWQQAERSFDVGRDFVMVEDGAAMKRELARVLSEPQWAESLRSHGLETIRKRHTCAHRVEQLLRITHTLRRKSGATPALQAGAEA